MQSFGPEHRSSGPNGGPPPTEGFLKEAANRSIVPGSGTPQIADHELLRCIGRGSYGEVWLARTVMGVYRAVKIIYRHAFKEARPFERELAGIQKYEPVSRSHEGLVDVLHIGRNPAQDYFYYVMELADDVVHGQAIQPETYCPQTLGEKLKRQGRLSPKECAQLGLALGQALEHLHQQGLVHRDIKPANIIFVNGTPKLADIGLVSGLDETCSLVGTQGYMAPEGPGQPAADVYSLGKVLYECCTGEDRTRFPHLPSELEASPDHQQFLELNEVILRTCQHTVAERYRSAASLNADLALVLHGRSVRRLRLLERRLARMKRVGISLGLVVLFCAGLAYQYFREREFRAEQRQRQVGIHLTDGLHDLEEGRLLQALPSFVETLRLDDPARAGKHRLRIGMTLEQCPKLEQMWVPHDNLSDGQFSSDGRLAVLASERNQVQVRDLQTGEMVGMPFGLAGLQTEASFSPDDRLVLIVRQTPTAELWDWRTGQRVLVLPHPRNANGIRFSPGADRIATSCMDKLVRVWETGTGKLVWELAGHTEGVLDVAFSHDGTLLASASMDQTVRLWDATTGKSLERQLPHKSWVYQASFSPDNRRLVTACFANTAHVWDVASGQETCTPLFHKDGVGSAVFSPDGRLILTGCWDGTARLWDAATGRPAMPNPVLPHSSRVLRAVFHPDGHRVLTVCMDGSARLWNLAGASSTAKSIPGPLCQDGSKAYSQSNQWITAAHAHDGQPFGQVELPGKITESALTPKGQVVIGFYQGPGAPTNHTELGIWNPVTGQRMFALAACSNSMASIAVSETAQRLVLWSSTQAHVYDWASDKPRLPVLVHSNGVSGAWFSPQGQKLATLSGNEVYLWDLLQGKLKHRLPVPDQISVVFFSPDGRLLVTGNADYNLTRCAAQVWDVESGQPLGPSLAHRDGVLHASFSPDSRRLVTSSEDFTAGVWDLPSGRKRHRLPHAHQVLEACFSPDGASVLTVCWDRTARLWDPETGEALTPLLPLEFMPQHGVFLDRDRLVLANRNIGSLWPLEPATQPVDDLVALAEVLSSQSLSHEETEPQAPALFTAWQRLKTKYPETFKTTAAELATWHRRQGQQARNERQWAGALFHFTRLAELRPNDRLASQWREEAAKKLRPEKQAGVISSP